MTDARPCIQPGEKKNAVCTPLARVSRHHRDDEEFDDSNDRRAGVCILHTLARDGGIFPDACSFILIFELFT